MKQFWLNYYQAFFAQLAQETPELEKRYRSLVTNSFYHKPHGKLAFWQQNIENLQGVDATAINLNSDTLNVKTTPIVNLETMVAAFKPWRKGPFQINDVFIDTEWRSDWKWNRIKNKIYSLKNKRVLDVGCGSGYHCFKMKSQGAEQVVGLEPMVSYVAQFIWLNQLFKQQAITLLPLTLEQWVNEQYTFDSVFSMGVLYHRRSPIDHLYELKQCLNRGGQLILETLIIEGEGDNVLVPKDRYAQMRNVWFIPSISHLKNWLQRVGFKDIEVIDINRTTIQEQRATQWMDFDSLINFLDPHDLKKTIEGYPSPLRATLTAIKK